MTSLLDEWSFPGANISSEGRTWSVEPLLYKGAASDTIKAFIKKAPINSYGPPRTARVTLLKKLHSTMLADFVSGGSRYTLRFRMRVLKNLYSWADSLDYELTEENIEQVYVEWTAHLQHKQRILKKIKYDTAYNDAAVVGHLLNATLDTYGIHKKSRIRGVKKRKKVLSSKADKQVIEDTFQLGCLATDICNSLTELTVKDRPPFKLEFKGGGHIDYWANFTPPEVSLNNHWAKIKPSWRRMVLKRIEKKHGDQTWATRHHVINLRIEAELLVFIAQTGMNLSQAWNLTISKFRYRSHIDGYQVHRVYKSRAGGEVAFEIFSEYRPLFERYLSWRLEFFGEDEDRLFPIRSPRFKVIDAPTFSRLKKICEIRGIRFVGTRELRNTRVNWLIRKSRDTELTAEMAQHTQQVLIGVYERPHHQAAAIEVSRFHQAKDKAIQAPGPGVCSKAADVLVSGGSDKSVTPDCVNPAGCLFCDHQRDVKSFDYVWSLTSFRHYQSLMLAGHRSPERLRQDHPAALSIDRVTAKLSAFRSEEKTCAGWCDESENRMLEGDYHPHWEFFIRLLEAA